jgi:predicted dehydrogenase
MSEARDLVSRRDFLKTSGTVAAASALSAASIPSVHAAGGDTVQVALVGCGGRGTGAAGDALATTGGDVRLVAMADVLQNRLNNSFNNLAGDNHFKDKVKVPEENKFLGFDAYKKAIDLLGKGDVVILTTPCGFRPLMFKYAIDKGVNVFMEKPVTVDGASSRKMLELNEEAKKKNIKVGVGLMVRHCKGRQQLFDRIKGGEIGDIVSMRAYRIHPPVGSAFSEPRGQGDKSELVWQIKRFHSFLWASGGLFSDFYIHQIDECCWMKDAWPVKAEAFGGRHYRGEFVDQNFDNYTVEYTFEDGTKFHYYGRHLNGCPSKFFSGVHGTKGSAIVSSKGHTPGEVRTFRSQSMDKDPIWAFPQPEPNPYRVEWQDLLDAVRDNKPYNEVERGVKASLVTSMGRMSAHTGQIITYDQILHSKHEFGAGIDEVTGPDSAPPVRADEKGKYPVPEPGIKKDREY